MQGVPQDAERGTMASDQQPDTNAPLDPVKRRTLKKIAALGVLGVLDTAALSGCGRRPVPRPSREKRVIVLGLDGLDPGVIARLLAQDKLPNMRRLAGPRGPVPLTSSVPPQSPVAWATFITGTDPGCHGIYDFLHRDPATYALHSGCAQTAPPRLTVPVGRWRLPLTGPQVALQRNGPAFWDVLHDRGVLAEVYRVPANFPPEDSGVRQLSGLGTPDLRGTLGEYSYYMEAPPRSLDEASARAVRQLRFAGGRARARLMGPPNTLCDGMPQTWVDFEVWADRERRLARLSIQDQQLLLREGEWSDWVQVSFRLVPGVKSRSGIARFYLKEVAPEFKLYVTPIHLDPMAPALPVAAPRDFARELAEEHGRFHTLGLPEDTAALGAGVLEDGEYLHQSSLVMAESRKLWAAALNRFRRGLLFYYFGESDRTQHVFWRTTDPGHPAYDPTQASEYGSTIEDCYRTCDEIVGEALEAADADTTVVVLSDHGFAPYYRRFELNTWLAENGYLVPARDTTLGTAKHVGARWDRTAAYGVGLNGVYLNLKGREGQGIVDPQDRRALLDRLAG
jgi:predicted AlkP superfamily phosphohydrolase/phosphomutase